MTTQLVSAIDSLSKPGVGLADALRGLYVVAARIGAKDLAKWLLGELNGYPDDAVVPSYRRVDDLPVRVRFDGCGGSVQFQSFQATELGELAATTKGLCLRQSVAEMTIAAAAGKTSGFPLPIQWVMRYRELAQEQKVPTLSMHVANEALIEVQRPFLEGVLDQIKTTALGFALEVKQVSATAGEVGGPTVATNAKLQEVVSAGLTTIYNIHMGDNGVVATGASSVAGQTILQLGDVDGLLREARKYLSEGGVEELRLAISEDGGLPAEFTRGFLARVRSGGEILASGVAGNAAYAGLLELLQAVIQGF